MEDFDVVMTSVDEDTVLVTGRSGDNAIEDRCRQMALAAFNAHDPSSVRYGAFLSDTTTETSGITLARIRELGMNAQSNLTNIKTINDIVRYYINIDDIVGKTYEAIETNVNTTHRLSYGDIDVEGGKITKRKKQSSISDVKAFIDGFNQQIRLESLIRSVIPVTYAEGTYILYLRSVNGGYVVDYYPLGVAVIADYELNGRPVVMIDIRELEARLKKTQIKTKSGKALFFETVEKEIQANYPEEVLKAFKAKERYAVLDHNRAKVIRINNINRKYGLTPIFRALSSVIMLETFANSDSVNARAMSKKIIFQKMRKEAMGPDFNKKAFDDMAYAHREMVGAFSQSAVLYTGPPQVEDVKYVESKVEMTDVDTIALYRNRAMATLGVSFLITEEGQSVTTASISVNQLLLTINKISEQLEGVLNDWYRLALTEQKLDTTHSPTIEIIDSEQMSIDVRKSLAEFLFSKLNAPYQTAYELVGYNIDDIRKLREQENEDGLDNIFTPRVSQYTSSGASTGSGGGGGGGSGGGGGRPPADTPSDKQAYDKEYNKARKEAEM